MGCFQSSEAGLHDQSMMARGGVRAGSVGGADDAAAAMLGNNALSSKVELFVSCANLRKISGVHRTQSTTSHTQLSPNVWANHSFTGITLRQCSTCSASYSRTRCVELANCTCL